MKLVERQRLNIFADFILKVSPHVSRTSVLPAVTRLPTSSPAALTGHSNIPGKEKDTENSCFGGQHNPMFKYCIIRKRTDFWTWKFPQEIPIRLPELLDWNSCCHSLTLAVIFHLNTLEKALPHRRHLLPLRSLSPLHVWWEMGFTQLLAAPAQGLWVGVHNAEEERPRCCVNMCFGIYQ